MDAVKNFKKNKIEKKTDISKVELSLHDVVTYSIYFGKMLEKRHGWNKDNPGFLDELIELLVGLIKIRLKEENITLSSKEICISLLRPMMKKIRRRIEKEESKNLIEN